MSYYGPGTEDIYMKALTPKEETALFRSYYAGNLDARDLLIKHFLQLTAKLALATSKGMLPEEDAVSAGNMGLMRALEKKMYDPSRGFRFSTYLRKYIKGQVAAALRARSRVVNGFPTRNNPLAEETERIELETNEKRMSDIPSSDPSIEDRDLENYRKSLIQKYLPTLKKSHQYIIKRIVFDGETFGTVSREMHISRQGVAQGYSRALKRLKEKLCIEYTEL